MVRNLVQVSKLPPTSHLIPSPELRDLVAEYPNQVARRPYRCPYWLTDLTQRSASDLEGISRLRWVSVLFCSDILDARPAVRLAMSIDDGKNVINRNDEVTRRPGSRVRHVEAEFT